METHVNSKNVTQRVAAARRELVQQADSAKRMLDAVNALDDGVWSSPAQREYAAGFHETYCKIEKFNAALAEYLASLDSLAVDCAAVDAAMQARLIRI